ncbi:MAG: YidC/Oxa1 family insertase periplasmic-domain containing protein, partial [Bacteroidales bacterium]
MNKDTVIGLVLIFALMIGYSLYFAPDPEEPPSESPADSVQTHQEAEEGTTAAKPDEARQEEQSEPAEGISPAADELQDSTAMKQESPDAKGSFSHAVAGKDSFYIIENDLMQLKIAKKGGRIAQVRLKEYQTYDSLPLILFTPDSSVFSFDFYNDADQIISTGDYYFEPVWYSGRPGHEMSVSGNDSLVFGMRLYDYRPGEKQEEPGYIEFLYKITGNAYMLDMDVRLNNLQNSMRSIYGNNVLDLKWA